MNKYEVIHQAFNILKNDVMWTAYEDAPYFEYFYAEDELYIIRDTTIGNYMFIKAKSPDKARERYEKMLEDVSAPAIDEIIKGLDDL